MAINDYLIVKTYKNSMNIFVVTSKIFKGISDRFESLGN